MFAIAMTCVVAGNVGAQVDGPRIVKNVNVIADVGGGTLTTTTSDPLPTPFSSFPDGFLAATKYCYFVAETPDQGRELCRFASSTTPTTYDKIDVFEITPDAGSTAPDLLTLVGDHLYFRASAHANRPLMHHKDGEVRTGVTPKVDPLRKAKQKDLRNTAPTRSRRRAIGCSCCTCTRIQARTIRTPASASSRCCPTARTRLPIR